jgi:crotonobetainyl-CoA:carnitine CoA-transferase CaiB-like acyl-CoA transferase
MDGDVGGHPQTPARGEPLDPRRADAGKTPARGAPLDPRGDGLLPLEGTRVLELGHIVAGPTAALILADLGADVVKIERPDGGDQARRMSGNGSVFHFLNRNKRSIIIDLKARAGKEVFRRLVRTADVVLDNYAPGVLERLGLGYDDLAAINPRLVYLSLKGFLPGPYEHRPSLDELAQMMGGLAYMTGPRGQPLRAGASIIDIGAATYGVIAVQAALAQRERTGRGQRIVAGLYETSVFWVGQWMVMAAMSGEPSVPMPEAGQSVRMGWGIFHLFPTADEGEQVFIAVTSNAHWERFCGALDLPDLLADENLDSNLKRVAARPWLLPRVREETAKYPSAALMERLEAAGVPCGPVRRPDQLLDDPHLVATEQLLPVPLPGGDVAPLPKLPWRSDAYAFGLRQPPPGLGEHTREVLAEAGLSDAEIDALLAEQAVEAGAPFDRAAPASALAAREGDTTA